MFAYLKQFRTLPAFLKALKESEARAVVHMAKVPDNVRKRFEGGTLRFLDQPADLQKVGEQADIAVLNRRSVGAGLLSANPRAALA